MLIISLYWMAAVLLASLGFMSHAVILNIAANGTGPVWLYDVVISIWHCHTVIMGLILM